MSWNRMSLLKKIAGTIMAITVVSTVSLSFMQDRLYNNNFETIFRSLEDSGHDHEARQRHATSSAK